jgi:glutathione S-transferase
VLQLVIGNKNYSSWSLRAWLLLTELSIEFEEVQLSLFSEKFTRSIGQYTPAKRVPVVVDETLAVWDSLAIAEYIAERFPDKGVWPRDMAARARARSVCAEMHAGFGALRNNMPMNVNASLPGLGWSVAVQNDLERIHAIWGSALNEHGGPFLFGAFSAADAYFAPVASRLATYQVSVPDASARYRDTILGTRGMRAWALAAATESEFLAEDEPYRRKP